MTSLEVAVATRARRAGSILIVLLVVAAGAVLGLLPLSLLLGQLWLLVPIAVGAAVAGLFTVLSRPSSAERLPTTIETALASLSVVYPPASLGLLLIVAYWLTYWLVRLANLALERWFARILAPEATAFWVVLVLLVFFGFAFAALATRVLTAQLSSTAAGSPIRHLADLEEHRRQLLGTTLPALALFALTLVVVLREWARTAWASLLLQTALMMGSVYLWRRLHESSRERRETTSKELATRLLEVAGFEVGGVEQFQTAEEGSFLRRLDLVAQGDGRTLVIELGDPDGEVEESKLYMLREGAYAVGQQLDLAAYEVEPILILVDPPGDSGLDRLASEAGVDVLRLHEVEIREVLRRAVSDPEEGQREALSLMAHASIWKSAV